MKALLGALGVLAVVATIVVLREAMMTRHTPVDPDTEMHLVVRASSNVAEADVGEMVAALFSGCQLEVATDPVGPPTDLGSGEFLLRIRPALDESNQRQIAGCIEDAKIDRLQAKVLSMEGVPAPGGALSR